MNVSFKKGVCGIMFEIGGRVKLKHISTRQIELMGIPVDYYHAGHIGEIDYVGRGYCSVRVGGGPSWSIEKEYLLTKCMFGKEVT